VAFPATRFIPSEDFPSPTAVPHRCGRCLLAVTVLSWARPGRSREPTSRTSRSRGGHPTPNPEGSGDPEPQRERERACRKKFQCDDAPIRRSGPPRHRALQRPEAEAPERRRAKPPSRPHTPKREQLLERSGHRRDRHGLSRSNRARYPAGDPKVSGQESHRATRGPPRGRCASQRSEDCRLVRAPPADPKADAWSASARRPEGQCLESALPGTRRRPIGRFPFNREQQAARGVRGETQNALSAPAEASRQSSPSKLREAAGYRALLR
jgi:hypothetical protein